MAVSLGVGLAVGLGGHGWAQYPPATGSVVLAAGNSTPTLGEEVAISATLQGEDGAPATNVACTFSIAQQPGTDAGVDAGPFTTDAAGNVSTTLDTGSAAGTIVVVATCGELSAQVSVVAGVAAAPPASVPGGPEAPAAPPASLPATGIGGDGGDAGRALWALMAVGVVVGLGALAIAWRRAKA